MKNSKLTLIALAASTVILAGCGGGGATSTVASTTPDPTTTTPAAASTINSVVATPTYATGSQQAVVYALLNAARVSCGFGSVSENTDLDQAAQAHANWLMINNYTGHFETATLPNGYTGVNQMDRGVAAGYVYSTEANSLVSDEIFADFGLAAEPGSTMLLDLLAAPYHLTGAMSGLTNVGIGYLDSDTAGTTSTYGERTILNIDFDTPYGAEDQEPDSSDVLTYPCQGTTGTGLGASTETPDPVPGRDLATSPIGQPISVYVVAGQILVLTSATMTDVATGAAVTLLAPVDSANDPNAELSSNEGFVMPNDPLTPNTGYEVTVNGTNNGTEFSRTFTFTTGDTPLRPATTTTTTTVTTTD